MASSVAAAVLMGVSFAATVVFDDFGSGAYSIGSSGPGSDIGEIVSPFADRRAAWGDGFPTWSSTVDIAEGVFTYIVDIRGDPSTSQWLTLSYWSSLGDMSLPGYDAFVIHVVSLSGIGRIMAFVGAGPNPSVTSVSLTEGDVVIPFANMAATDPENPRRISFRITPQGPDFSVTIGGIGIIPEPSTAAAAGIGVILLTARRRRKTR